MSPKVPVWTPEEQLLDRSRTGGPGAMCQVAENSESSLSF